MPTWRLIVLLLIFTANSPLQNDVQIANTSETETLFVNVEVLEVTAPGTPEETRIVADDPSQIGLIATPDRVILPPGSRRLVRLVNLFPAEKEERIFRVNFTPVAGEFEAEQSTVRLMVGYQALVIVRPNTTETQLVGSREGNILTLENKGNTNVYLDRIRQCQDDKPDECTPMTENRLYPGNVWELELEQDGPITFNAFDGIRSQSMVFLRRITILRLLNKQRAHI